MKCIDFIYFVIHFFTNYHKLHNHFRYFLVFSVYVGYFLIVGARVSCFKCLDALGFNVSRQGTL
jgi:hypothetical protein